MVSTCDGPCARSGVLVSIDIAFDSTDPLAFELDCSAIASEVFEVGVSTITDSFVWLSLRLSWIISNGVFEGIFNPGKERADFFAGGFLRSMNTSLSMSGAGSFLPAFSYFLLTESLPNFSCALSFGFGRVRWYASDFRGFTLLFQLFRSAAPVTLGLLDDVGPGWIFDGCNLAGPLPLLPICACFGAWVSLDGLTGQTIPDLELVTAPLLYMSIIGFGGSVDGKLDLGFVIEDSLSESESRVVGSFWAKSVVFLTGPTEDLNGDSVELFDVDLWWIGLWISCLWGCNSGWESRVGGKFLTASVAFLKFPAEDLIGDSNEACAVDIGWFELWSSCLWGWNITAVGAFLTTLIAAFSSCPLNTWGLSFDGLCRPSVCSLLLWLFAELVSFLLRVPLLESAWLNPGWTSFPAIVCLLSLRISSSTSVSVGATGMPRRIRFIRRRSLRCSDAVIQFSTLSNNASMLHGVAIPRLKRIFWVFQSNNVSSDWKLDSGSQVHLSSGYPSHLTRYSAAPSTSLSAIIASTGYSSLGSLGAVEVIEIESSSLTSPLSILICFDIIQTLYFAWVCSQSFTGLRWEASVIISSCKLREQQDLVRATLQRC